MGADGGGLTFRQVGAEALLVEAPDGAVAEALYAELLARRGSLPEVTEIVPAARTVLLDGVADVAALRRELAGWQLTGRRVADGPTVSVPVPVVYDGADLEEVAGLWGMSVAEAVRVHSSVEYRVAFCGFAPGFAYLTGLPERYHVPRRATPRSAVPAGSVALAGPYTGVYPRSSPGGWQLIGRTAAVLWDASREPAALLVPGARVRFVPGTGA